MQKTSYASLAVVVLLVVLLSFTVSMSTSNGYYETGNSNIMMTATSNSILVAKYSTSQTIDSTSSAATAGNCTVSGEWSLQNNVLEAQSNGPDSQWLQQIVLVDQSGNSCYTVEYWPDYQTSPSPDYYAFTIGYSSGFYNNGVTVYTELDASAGYVTDWYVGNPSDNWVIYPSNLLNSPSVTFSTSLGPAQNFVMVGNGGCRSASFDSGAGTIYYYDSGTPGFGYQVQSCESSNMVYTLPPSSGSGYLYNSFAYG
jgi:hypothetical protein